MTGATMAAPTLRSRGGLGREPSLFDDVGGESTLDELLVGVWEGLAAHRVVACPACGSDMKPTYGVHARPIGGRCRGCGTTLA